MTATELLLLVAFVVLGVALSMWVILLKRAAQQWFSEALNSVAAEIR